MEHGSQELQFSVPWGQVAAVAWGSPSNKKVLLVHGRLDNAGSFERLIALLPNSYYYVCIDLPGHGLSSHFPEGQPLYFYNFVFTIYLIVKQLQWDNFVYISHSFGCHIGTNFCALYPNKISQLILIDGIMPFPVRNDNLLNVIRETFEEILEVNKKRNPPLYTKDEVIHALMYKRTSTLNSEAANVIFKRAVTTVNNQYKFNRDIRLKGFIHPLLNISQNLEILINVKTPVLLIIAKTSLDTFVTKDIVGQLKNFKENMNNKVIFVEGNHDVHNNNPERVAPFICEFLKSSIMSKL